MATITVRGKSYEFDLLEITAAEATAVEKATGLNGFAWWKSLANEPSVEAIHGLLFVLQRRDDPRLRFEDVQFTVADWMTRVEVETSEPETQPSRGKAKAPSTT